MQLNNSFDKHKSFLQGMEFSLIPLLHHHLMAATRITSYNVCYTKLLRYQTNYLTAYILILVTIIALIFAGFKIANILFNLIFNQLLAPLVFASDLHNSGRSKKFLQNLLSSYLIFLIVMVLMKLFLDITAWAMTDAVMVDGSMVATVILKIFIVGGCAKGLIDGPDIVVSVLGMDAGVKSGLSVIAGAAAGVGLAKTASNAVSKTVGGAVKAPGRLANGVV